MFVFKPQVNIEMNCHVQDADYFGNNIENTTAIDALKTGLGDLLDMVSHIRDSYAADLAKKEYVEFEEIA